MCSSATCTHNTLLDLEDDFDGAAPAQATAAAATAEVLETCKKCRGRGKFIGYSGRVLGDCFTCKGKGKVAFKTTADVRLKQREQARARAKRAAASNLDNWAEANPAEAAWMRRNGTFGFALAMMEAVAKYGSLTEKQLAAVHSCMSREIMRDQQRAEAAKADAARVADAKAVAGLEPIVVAFEQAKERGLKRPKVRLGSVKLSLAPATGRNAGSIYVVEAASDTYLGKITEGRFIRSRECSPEQEAEVLAVCADPKAAAVAYGRRTGECCICGRELTNKESIELGIGPICAEKFGW